MQVKTSVKAGGTTYQHNEAQVRATARGLKVRTGIKAGKPSVSEIPVTRPVDVSSTNLF